MLNHINNKFRGFAVALLLGAGLHALPALADATPGDTGDAYQTLLKYGLLTEPAAATEATAPDAGPAETSEEQLQPPAAEEVISATPPEPADNAQSELTEPESTQIVTTAAAPAQASDDDAAAVRMIHSYSVLERLGLLASTKPRVKTYPAKPTTPARPPRLVDRVLVDKSERKLVLLKDGKPVREYQVSLGGEPNGPKVREGDLRTPEGTYTLDWRNPESRFYKSFHISYPNPVDLERAESLGVEPGGMIMIHGEHPMSALRNIYRRIPKDWTEGCIAMRNEHIDELWTLLDDGTPIEIRP